MRSRLRSWAALRNATNSGEGFGMWIVFVVSMIVV